jgi:MFS family permease
MTRAKAARGTLSRGHLAGIVAGNVLEVYDFTVFAFFAVQIGKTIFAGHGGDGLLATLASFSVGFVARPIGAVVIGRYADRAGRRPAMMLSFVLMGLSMIVVALTPPASVIGVWSGVIVSLARLGQGFALGGEVGPSAALLVEAASPGRRGAYGSWQMASQGLASLLAGVVGLTITASMSPSHVVDYGWRIALLFGAIVLPVGLYLRRKLPETIAHDELVVPEAAAAPPPIRRIVQIGFLLIASNSVTLYTLQFVGTYSMAVLHLSPFVAFLMTSIIGATLFVFALTGGRLSDRLGRRPFLVWPRLALLIAAYPAFAMVTASPSIARLALVTFGLTACFGLFTAAANVALVEILPKARRSSGYALTYTLGVTVFGGSAQFVVAWLTKETGSTMVPAYALLGASVVGLIAGLFMPLRRTARDISGVTSAGSAEVHHA